jgi:branched-chain amino acid transport system permease protein
MASLRGPERATVVLAGVLLLVPVVGGDFFAYQIGLYLIYALVAQGIALAWGRVGFLPLGQSLFFGLGAYIGGFGLKAIGDAFPDATVSLAALPAALPSPAVVAAALLATVAVLAAAALLPAALAWGVGRLVFARRHESGPYFSLITLALAMLGFQVANQWSSLTGGFNGLGGIPDIPLLDRYGSLYYVIAAVVVVMTAAFVRIGRTPLGTLWSGIAQNENRLQLFGFATDRLKALAFATSAAAAGMAGALYAAHQGLVTPQATGFLLSAEFVIWTAVGGRSSPYGALLGAVGIGLLSAELREQVSWWEAIVALVFVGVVLRFPGGLIGGLRAAGNRLLAGLARLRRPGSADPEAHPGAQSGAQSGVGVNDRRAGDDGSSNQAAAAAAPRQAARLRYQGVQVRSHGVDILAGLDLDIGGGGIHCLIGPNGAGKTSTFNVLTGRLPLTAGRILLDDVDVSNRRADAVARLGVGRKLQIPSVFPALSVADNLRIAIWANRLRRRQWLQGDARHWTTPLLQALRQELEFLDAAAERPAGELSQGQRQMLELAMTLLSEPRLLLLDEPCAGLSPQETRRQIGIILIGVRTLGATALIVEHDMAAVEALASKVHVLHQGRLLASGTLAQVQADAAVRSVYAGGRK